MPKIADRESVRQRVERLIKVYKNMGMQKPAWLEKQENAVKIAHIDPQRSLVMLLDGMQDEVDYLTEIEMQADLERFDNG